jgi:hypothetical protein
MPFLHMRGEELREDGCSLLDIPHIGYNLFVSRVQTFSWASSAQMRYSGRTVKRHVGPDVLQNGQHRTDDLCSLINYSRSDAGNQARGVREYVPS